MEVTTATLPHARGRVAPADVPPPVSLRTMYAVLFASASVVVGVLWDISWHQSIGRDTLLSWLYAFAAALVLLNFATMVSEYTWRIFQHGTLFYQIVAGVLLMPLVAAGVSGRLRWAATAAAGMYFGVLLALVWILPLFPAEPKLAPVLFPLTRMMPAQFPLLLFVPAIGIDLVLQRWTRPRGWLLAAVLSIVFVSMFIAVQWPFATLLNSEYARNPLLGQHLRPYMVPETSAFAQGRFLNSATGVALMMGLVIALVLGTVSARLGIGWGQWMRRVQR